MEEKELYCQEQEIEQNCNKPWTTRWFQMKLNTLILHSFILPTIGDFDKELDSSINPSLLVAFARWNAICCGAYVFCFSMGGSGLFILEWSLCLIKIHRLYHSKKQSPKVICKNSKILFMKYENILTQHFWINSESKGYNNNNQALSHYVSLLDGSMISHVYI